MRVEKFKITLPRVEETLKKSAPPYKVQQRIKKPDTKTCNFAELQNWAMVCYFLAAGNRLSAVANIRIGDVRFQDNEVFIRKTKQKK
jgi:integrase/recombinase XerD